MNSRKSVIQLVGLTLAVWLCTPCALPAQGNFLNPNSPNKDKPANNTPPPQKPVASGNEQDQEPTGRVTLEQVTTELERLQKLEGDNAPKEKDKLVELLTQAQNFLKEEQQYRDEAAKMKVDPKAIAAEVAQKKEVLNEPLPDVEEEIKPFRFPAGSTPILEQIQQTLMKANQRLTELKQTKLENENALKDVDSKIVSREDRLKKIPGELTDLDKRLEEVNKALQAMPPEDESRAVTLARQAALRAEQQMLLEKRKYLTQEAPYYEARKELRNLEKQVLQKQIAHQQRLIEALQKQIVELGKREAAAQVIQARDIVKEAPEPLKDLAREVAENTKLRNSPEGPLNQIASLQSKKENATQQLNMLKTERDRTEERLSVSVRSRPQTLAPILDYQRSLLPSVYQYEEGEITHSRQAIESLSEKLKYKEQYEDLADLDDELESLLDGIPEKERTEKLNGKSLEELALELLGMKRDILGTLQDDYDKLQTVSEELAETEGKLVVFITDYEEYLDEQSLWVPMAEVLQWRDFKKIKQGFAPLLKPANWTLLGQTLVEEILKNPIWSGVIVILLLLFVPTQTRLKRRLFQLSDEFSDSFLAPFHLTWKAFCITLLLPLWIPVLGWLVGYRLLRVLPTTSDQTADLAFVPAFGKALVVVAFILCVLRLTRYLVKSNGLGEVHYRWPKQQLAKVRIHQHWFTLCVVPLVFLITMIYDVGTSEARRSTGRILMVALMLLSSWFLYRILAPTRSKDERTSPVQLSLWKKILTYGPCCVPLFFALLSISGYTYTAAVLMGRLIFSSGILLLLVMVYELAYRWVYIARGRLALEQARQRQEAREAQAAAHEGSEGSEAPRMFDPGSAGVDLSSINTQTRQLLATSFGLAVFFSMWWVWSDVSPQIGVLDYAVFPAEQIAQITQDPPAAEGAEVTPTLEPTGGVTIGDLLLIVLAIIVTVVASKNLPGLLEISVLQNLPLNTGIRYAAGTIARYIVIAIGIVVCCGFLNIGVTEVSILLGGLAVGLGFGLQEMFANFISGIILLFEQPLRVGDIVTINDVTGSVSRIRIRATTITDWDRKEFIIPNKEFITGQFNNWTLTDKTNRVVITVGVAYGSNTELAREIILRVCADHPEVLEDPAPMAFFEGFGNSTLTMVLRCYLPRLDNRLLTIHELHTAIDREFKKAGIEIAFPQMDLHLRSVDPIRNPIPLQQEVPEPEKAYPEN